MFKFGEALRSARKAKGLSQTELAEAVSKTQGFIGNIERGEQHLSRSPELVAKFEFALGLAPGELARHLEPDHVARKLVNSPISIPLIGVVGAGPGRDEPADPGETLKLGEVFEGCVAYQVSGNSMEQLGILPGDYVIARPRDRSAKDYPPGTQMVAWVDGAGAMVKEWTGTALRSPDSFRHQVDGLKDDIVGILVAVLRIESSKPKKRRKK